MTRFAYAALLAASVSFSFTSLYGEEESKQPKAEAQTNASDSDKPAEDADAAEETLPPSPLVSEMGYFGSDEVVERKDMPQRGVLTFTTEKRNEVFMPGEHWEQYNFPFKASRPGRYQVRLNYVLKRSTLGVRLNYMGRQLKKSLTASAGMNKVAYLGEITIASPGDQFLALYTPSGVAWSTFELHEISLIPAPENSEELKFAGTDSIQLHAKDAVTWSEKMRYEDKPEKNCLGFWTEKEDFAEWEFTVDKAGKFEVTVHQGCGAGGGSQVAILLNGQELEFTVKDTGGFQKWEALKVGKFAIDKPGTYRLAVKPVTKKGAAIMDIQKVTLAPVS